MIALLILILNKLEKKFILDLIFLKLPVLLLFGIMPAAFKSLSHFL